MKLSYLFNFQRFGLGPKSFVVRFFSLLFSFVLVAALASCSAKDDEDEEGGEASQLTCEGDAYTGEKAEDDTCECAEGYTKKEDGTCEETEAGEGSQAPEDKFAYESGKLTFTLASSSFTGDLGGAKAKFEFKKDPTDDDTYSKEGQLAVEDGGKTLVFTWDPSSDYAAAVKKTGADKKTKFVVTVASSDDLKKASLELEGKYLAYFVKEVVGTYTGLAGTDIDAFVDTTTPATQKEFAEKVKGFYDALTTQFPADTDT